MDSIIPSSKLLAVFKNWILSDHDILGENSVDYKKPYTTSNKLN